MQGEVVYAGDMQWALVYAREMFVHEALMQGVLVYGKGWL